MTDIQVTLISEQNFGDHGALVRTAHLVEPDETVEHLLLRLMRAGDFAQPYRNSESPSSWIEIRYVDGTLPDPPERVTNAFAKGGEPDAEPPMPVGPHEIGCAAGLAGYRHLNYAVRLQTCKCGAVR